MNKSQAIIITEVNIMETTYKPTKSIVETMNEARKSFEEAYGRLLTEDEAIKLTSDIKKALKKEGKLDEN